MTKKKVLTKQERAKLVRQLHPEDRARLLIGKAVDDMITAHPGYSVRHVPATLELLSAVLLKHLTDKEKRHVTNYIGWDFADLYGTADEYGIGGFIDRGPPDVFLTSKKVSMPNDDIPF